MLLTLRSHQQTFAADRFYSCRELVVPELVFLLGFFGLLLGRVLEGMLGPFVLMQFAGGGLG